MIHHPILRGWIFVGMLMLMAVAVPSSWAEGRSGGVPAFFRSYGFEPVPLVLTAGNSHLNEGNHGLETRFIVHGKLGAHSLVMFVDTGCSFSTIESRHVGNPAERVRVNQTNIDLTGGRTAVLESVKLEPIQLGRCLFMAQPADVVTRFAMEGYEDEAAIGSMIQRRTSDSDRPQLVLGWDFLVRNLAWLDCGRHTLHFIGSPMSTERANQMAATLKSSGFDEVDLVPPHRTWGLVPVSWGDKSSSLLVDTGASFTLLDESEVVGLGLTLNSMRSRVSGFKGVSADLSIATLPNLQLGSHRIGKTDVGVTSLKALNRPRTAAHQSPILGILGMDLLVREGALIDFVGGRVFFQRPRNEGK
jgi:predicted aspartyl protease